MTTAQAQSAAQSALVLGNAAELGARLVRHIAGNDISTSINGNPATKQLLVNIIAARIHKNLTARRDAARG